VFLSANKSKFGTNTKWLEPKMHFWEPFFTHHYLLEWKKKWQLR
jgi:hypothetical protein